MRDRSKCSSSCGRHKGCRGWVGGRQLEDRQCRTADQRCNSCNMTWPLGCLRATHHQPPSHQLSPADKQPRVWQARLTRRIQSSGTPSCSSSSRRSSSRRRRASSLQQPGAAARSGVGASSRGVLLRNCHARGSGRSVHCGRGRRTCRADPHLQACNASLQPPKTRHALSTQHRTSGLQSWPPA